MNAIKFFLFFGIFNLCLAVLYIYTAIIKNEPIIWFIVLIQILLSGYLIRIYAKFPYNKKDFNNESN